MKDGRYGPRMPGTMSVPKGVVRFFRNVRRTPSKKNVDVRSTLVPSDRFSKFLRELKKK